jgi:hypothetical protein
MFAVANARTIVRTESVPRNIRSDSKLALILVKPDGAISCATGAADKDSIVRAYDPVADCLLLAWAGQWKTEVFRLDLEDLALIYGKPLPGR